MAIFGKSNQINYDLYSSEDLESFLNSSNYAKGGMSKEMEDVYKALHKFNTFSIEIATQESFFYMTKAHAELIKACDTYLSAKSDKHHSKMGKERLSIVQAISNIAKNEDYKDYDVSSLLTNDELEKLRKQDAEQKEARKNDPKARRANYVETSLLDDYPTWDDVMSDFRPLKKRISPSENFEKAGAASSSRIKFEEGYFTESYKLRFYKGNAEHIAQIHTDILNDMFNEMFSSDKALLGNYKEDIIPLIKANLKEHFDERDYESPEIIEETRNGIASLKGIRDLPDAKKNLVIDKVFDMHKTVIGRLNDQAFRCANMKEGIDLTLNNVATSRLADMLGQSSLIAKSQRMTVIDTDGVKHHGVVMAKAVGMDLSKATQEQKQDFLEADTKDPEFQKQMSRLAIMDLIAGQTDRHARNMFYNMEKDSTGKPIFKGVQGIDNDACFGEGLIPRGINDSDARYLSNHGNKLGYLSDIKIIDRTMYNNLKHLNDDTLHYMFKDVMSQERIDFIKKRVEEVIDYVDAKENDVLITDKFDESTYERVSKCPTMHKIDVTRKSLKLEMKEAAKEAPATEETSKEAPTTEAPVKEAPTTEEPKKEQVATEPKNEQVAPEPKKEQVAEEPKKEQAAEAPKRKPAPTAPKRVQTNFNELSKAGWRSQFTSREMKFTIGRDRTQKPAAKKPSGPSMD